VIAANLDGVERVLRRFLDDLEALGLPADVEYLEPPLQLARERSLDEVLGPT
jgi:hypothetical protein